MNFQIKSAATVSLRVYGSATKSSPFFSPSLIFFGNFLTFWATLGVSRGSAEASGAKRALRGGVGEGQEPEND